MDMVVEVFGSVGEGVEDEHLVVSFIDRILNLVANECLEVQSLASVDGSTCLI